MSFSLLNPYHSALCIVRTKWIVLTKVNKATFPIHLCLAPELMRVEDDALNV